MRIEIPLRAGERVVAAFPFRDEVVLVVSDRGSVWELSVVSSEDGHYQLQLTQDG